MQTILSFLRSIVNSIRQALVPKQAFSWQTLIGLSIFSYLMAALASPLVREFLAICGWIFLILGTGWLTTEYPLKFYNLNLGPWITGALISLLLFGYFFEEMPSLAIVSWPVISAVIATLPKFFDANFKFQNPGIGDRQFLVVLLLSNLIISCWLQFYFTIQSWTQEYPTLLTENLSRSAFVVRLSINPVNTPRGQLVLNEAESVVKGQVENQPWSKVERWLLDITQEPQSFSRNVIQQLILTEAQAQNGLTRRTPKVLENFLWRVESQVLPGSPYQLQIFAIWQGPSFSSEGYYLTRTCEIAEVPRPQGELPALPSVREQIQNIFVPPSDTIGKVTCDSNSDLQPGRPEVLIQ